MVAPFYRGIIVDSFFAAQATIIIIWHIRQYLHRADWLDTRHHAWLGVPENIVCMAVQIVHDSIADAAMESRPHPLIQCLLWIHHICACPELYVMKDSSRLHKAASIHVLEHSDTVEADHMNVAKVSSTGSQG